MKQTVVFDFDGVIHSYKSGWQGTTIIPDEPVEGIKEAIAKIREAGYEVVVVSTRCENYYGQMAITEYLKKHDIEVDKILKEKPPAIVYIDDRAICFDGNAGSLLEKIRKFQPWNKTDKNVTNFDRIKAMSIEEMAEFIKSMVDENETHEVGCYGCSFYGCHHSDPKYKGTGLYECEDCSNESVGLDLIKWLESEVE